MSKTASPKPGHILIINTLKIITSTGKSVLGQHLIGLTINYDNVNQGKHEVRIKYPLPISMVSIIFQIYFMLF